MNNIIQNITIENKRIDRDKFFMLGYCPEIEKHLLCVHISWVAGYDRYYVLDEEDTEMYEKEPEEFYKKYEKEIKAVRTRKLIGAGALRDYNFRSIPDEVLKALDKYPPFEGYFYQDGILYARVKIGERYVSLPPIYDEN